MRILTKPEKQITEYDSQKIKAISFVCMVLVVFIHSSTSVFNIGTKSIHNTNIFLFFLQSLISDGIARIAVPAFFAISGFLFFNRLSFTVDAFINKFKKRFTSLVIPYLFWSLASLLFYFLLQQFYFSKNFFTARIIANLSFAQLLHIIFLDPWAYQLWFVKDLVMLIIVSPLLYFFIQRLPLIILLFASVVWVFYYPLYIFQSSSLIFFVIGGCLAFYNLSFSFFKQKNVVIILLFGWLFLCVVRTYLMAIHTSLSFYTLSIFQDVSIVVGMLAVWFGYDLLMKNQTPTKWWANIFSYSFFLYAFHEPLLTILRKASFYYCNKSDTSLLLIYLIAPSVTIFIALTLAIQLQKIVPNFYKLITGGRG